MATEASHSEPVSGLPPVELEIVEPPSINAFCDAIRSKKNWFHKILDGARNLGPKWATEAGLMGPDGPMSEEVAAALKELQNEAQRIIFFDYTIRMEDPVTFKEPDLNLDMDALDSEILASLRYTVTAPFGVRSPRNLTEEVGVFISDNLVPVSLHRELVSHLDALAMREPLDLHPGSNGKVQDLIHPSLYPFVLGESVLDDPSNSETLPSLYSTVATIGEWDSTLSSRYAWIPSVFNVSEDEMNVHIDSYVNGLGPREHFPRLYRLIEKLFLFALPHFRATLDFEYEPDSTPAVWRWKKRWLFRTEDGVDKKVKRSEWYPFLQQQAAERKAEDARMEEAYQEWPKHNEIDRTDRAQFASDDTINAVSFEGHQLKVIVKAANYQLKRGETYEGSWHMEGMPHERIVASVIYYYETDVAIVDQGLKFRKVRDSSVDFPEYDDYRHESFSVEFRPEADSENIDGEEDSGSDGNTDDYPSDWGDDHNTSGLPRFLPLGTVPTTNFNTSATGEAPGTGRILSFPNWIQHQVGKLSVAEDTPEDHVAKRKILCFFLVDDDDENSESADKNYHGLTFENLTNRVLTSSDVPLQARMTNFRTLRFLLPLICLRLTGQNLPPELVQHIFQAASWGFSREEAERHRHNLMKDRVIGADATSINDTFSLCEH
ncbi:hypothetical protein B0H19DRAFT_1119924 [Mycena capillaripes]|nr:hypothetical protein B0H19DRAFT_1119924 [Mycena capillaripes]